MSTLKCFEDIEVWQLAREFNKSIHHLIQNSGILNNFKLRDQMYGSGGSIMDNIAEGFERDNNREFVLFLSYAKGSAGEIRSQLYRSLDFNYIDEGAFETHCAKAKRISRKLRKLIDYLKKSGVRGLRYK